MSHFKLKMAGYKLITLQNTPSVIIIYRKETDSETNSQLLANASHLSKCRKHQAKFMFGMRKTWWSGNNPVKKNYLVYDALTYFEVCSQCRHVVHIDVLLKSHEDKDSWRILLLDMYVLGIPSKACLQQRITEHFLNVSGRLCEGLSVLFLRAGPGWKKSHGRALIWKALWRW